MAMFHMRSVFLKTLSDKAENIDNGNHFVMKENYSYPAIITPKTKYGIAVLFLDFYIAGSVKICMKQ